MKIEITLSVLVIFPLLPMAQAVSPAPDGGYAGGNTAEGQNALLSLSSGTYNTAVGFLSLKSDTAGQFNTATGAGALLSNLGDSNSGAGVENTATGAGALLSNTTGCCNTASGAFALFSNTNSAENSAFGNNAHTGGGNTAIGSYCLISNTTGVLNTAVGVSALAAHVSGDKNTALGYVAGGNVTTANNVICIGALVGGANVDNSCYIGNIWNQPGGSQAVYVNSDGKLGLQTSSRRFKDEIQPMEQASEVIYSLKPVSFRYKPEIEPTRPRGFGLIAEDVEKVSPNLVTRSSDGKVNSVRYDAVNAMLLNEFLKEHRKVEELQATVLRQEKSFQSRLVEQEQQIQALTAGLQRVRAELETRNAPLQMVLNRP